MDYETGGVGAAQQRLQKCEAVGKFKLGTAYHLWQGVNNKVRWAGTVWDGLCIPHHSFCTWLAAQSSIAYRG